MTKAGGSGNINKSSARAAGELNLKVPPGKRFKEVLKNLKKVLDKGETRW